MLGKTLSRELSIASKAMDINIMRSNAYTEMAISEAAISAEEAELKVFTESGQNEDLVALYEQAQDGFIGKVKKAIEAIIKAVKEFFATLKDKIIAIFSKKELETSLEQIEKKSKLNPFLRNAKVEVQDGEKANSVFKAYMEKIKTFVTRIKSGDKVTSEEVDDAREEFFRKHAVALGATAALTVAASVALIRKKLKSTGKDVSDCESGVAEILDKANGVVSSKGDSITSEAAALLQRLSADAAAAAKAHSNKIIALTTSAISAVKSKVSGMKKTEAKEDALGESAQEEMNEEDTLVQEGASDDIFSEFDAMFL